VLAASLSSAFDRLDDFLAVQGPCISSEAVTLLQEAAGVTERDRRLIADRLEALQPSGQPASGGAVLLGVLVGLFAAQFQSE
jgi:hypothetical protein